MRSPKEFEPLASLHYWFLAFLLLCISRYSAGAQEATPDPRYNTSVLAACDFVPVTEDVRLSLYHGEDVEQFDFKGELEVLMEQLNDWKGRDIWLGYPEGFDFPADAIPAGRLRLHRANFEIDLPGLPEQQMIDFSYSPSLNEYFVLPFDNMVPFTDENGNYFGVHPCGAYAISSETMGELVETFTSANLSAEATDSPRQILPETDQ